MIQTKAYCFARGKNSMYDAVFSMDYCSTNVVK